MTRPRRALTPDQLERKRQRDRERARDHREEYGRLRGLSLEAHLRSGWDEESAVAEVYWVPVHVQRQREATAKLRASGLSGRSFDALARRAFREEVESRLYLELENAVRGAVLSRRGERCGFDPREFWHVNEATARAMASEEARLHWDRHGRPTFAQFRDGLLTGRGARPRGGLGWAA